MSATPASSAARDIAQRTDPEDQLGADAFALMKELVAITGEKWVGASRFSALADRWVGDDVAARIALLTGIKALMRTMPTNVYADLDARQSVLGAAQEALDQAIDLEDAEEDAKEDTREGQQHQPGGESR